MKPMPPKQPKPPQPEKHYEALGKLVAVPLEDWVKPVNKLLTRTGIHKGEDLAKLWLDDEVPPTVAFVRSGATRVKELELKGKKAGVYIVDGDLTATDYFELNHGDQQAVLYVTGNLTTKYLRVGFASTLLVGGNLTADYIIYDGFGIAVGGATAATKILVYYDGSEPNFGKHSKKMIADIEATVGDTDPDLVFKRMINGKRFLVSSED